MGESYRPNHPKNLGGAKTLVTNPALAKARAALKSAAVESPPEPAPTMTAPAGSGPAKGLRETECFKAALTITGGALVG